jgi:hypothetical protein
MSTKPKPTSSLPKTPNFNFIFGSYSMSARTIPYFQVSLSFRDAARYLTLVDDLPGASSMDWRVEELFQRDIDWNRVEKGIIPYLQDHDRPQFFNSLSIALIPRQESQLKGFDDSPHWAPPALDDEGRFDPDAIKCFGPLRCGYWGPWDDPKDSSASFGELAWNIDQIAAVAIDGQHRLAAIKELERTSQQQILDAHVPAILLVFDPRLGYTGETDYESTLMTMRRLFIDLNKHARTVNRARRILLDDREPVSICVRSVVGNQLKTGEDELLQQPPTLPLTLVDWHSEQAKFEEGPYLTTILGLDWIVSQLLGIKPMDDSMDHQKIKKSLNMLEQRTLAKLDGAKKRLEKAIELERPFSFLDGDAGESNELTYIAQCFASTWSAGIIHVLTALTPYSELLRNRREYETLTPQFANWNALKSREETIKGRIQNLSKQLSDLKTELQNDPRNPINTAQYDESLAQFDKTKRSSKIAFTVVFQRALFIAFGRLVSISENQVATLASFNNGTADTDSFEAIIADEFDDDDDVQTEDESESIAENGQDFSSRAFRRAHEFVDALNTVYAKVPEFYSPHFFPSVDGNSSSERFWNGSLTLPDATMDYSQVASKRASELLFAIGLVYLIKKNSTIHDYSELIDSMEKATSGPLLKLRNALSVMASRGHIADIVLKNREVAEVDRTDDARRDLIVPKIQAIWSVFL